MNPSRAAGVLVQQNHRYRVSALGLSVALFASIQASAMGGGEGLYSEGDANKVQLSRGDQTESFDVAPGTSHWKGYTTFVKGVVFT